MQFKFGFSLSFWWKPLVIWLVLGLLVNYISRNRRKLKRHSFIPQKLKWIRLFVCLKCKCNNSDFPYWRSVYECTLQSVLFQTLSPFCAVTEYGAGVHCVVLAWMAKTTCILSAHSKMQQLFHREVCRFIYFTLEAHLVFVLFLYTSNTLQ